MEKDNINKDVINKIDEMKQDVKGMFEVVQQLAEIKKLNLMLVKDLELKDKEIEILKLKLQLKDVRSNNQLKIEKGDK